MRFGIDTPDRIFITRPIYPKKRACDDLHAKIAQQITSTENEFTCKHKIAGADED